MSRKYRNHYEIRNEETAKGLKKTVIYVGDHYRFSAGDKQRKVLAGKTFIAGSVNIALFAAAGMMNGEFSRNIFILLPYVIQFLPAVMLVIAAISLFKIKGDLTVPQFKTVFVRIKTMSVLNVFLEGVIVAEAIIVALISRSFPGTHDILFTVFTAAMSGGYIGIIILHTRIGKDVNILGTA